MRNIFTFLLVLFVLYTIAVRGFQFLSDLIEWLNRMSKLKQQPAPPSSVATKSAEEMRREVEQFVHERSPFGQESVFTHSAAVPVSAHTSKKTKATRSKHVKIPESDRTHTDFHTPSLTGTADLLTAEQGAATAAGVFHWMDSPQSIQTAIVMSEILRRPEW